MKYCPNPKCPHILLVGKAAEFRDEVQFCSDCGTILAANDLRGDIERDHKAPPEPETPMVVVGRFREASLAYLAKGRLEQEGISAFLRDESISGLDRNLSTKSGAIKLEVAENDAPKAIEILGKDHSNEIAEIGDEIEKLRADEKPLENGERDLKRKGALFRFTRSALDSYKDSDPLEGARNPRPNYFMWDFNWAIFEWALTVLFIFCAIVLDILLLPFRLAERLKGQ